MKKLLFIIILLPGISFAQFPKKRIVYVDSTLSNVIDPNYLPQVAISGYWKDLLYKPTPMTALTTVGTNGVSTFDPITGILNIPAYVSKRQETYSGITVSTGIYAITFPVPFTVAPNIQVNLIGGTNKTTAITTVTNTGFSIYVQARADILGLLPTYSNVTGQAIDVLVTEK